MVVEDASKWLPADNCTQVMKLYSVMWLKFFKTGSIPREHY